MLRLVTLASRIVEGRSSPNVGAFLENSFVHVDVPFRSFLFVVLGGRRVSCYQKLGTCTSRIPNVS